MITITSPQSTLKNKGQVRATDLPFILNEYGDKIKILSLDCFDTLLWRKTAAPKDVFYAMQQRPLFKSLGITAHQRISAAARAYRMKFIQYGTREITLSDIYHNFTALTNDQQNSLIEEECAAEMALCYAFMPMVNLIREAHARGIHIVITSNTYLSETQLRQLLDYCLPTDAMQMIERVFCSSEFGKSKSDGLFEQLLLTLGHPASSLLHIGDHLEADVEAPKKLGLHALHFLQFDQATTDVLRMQHASAALSFLANPETGSVRSPRYNPFRGVFSLTDTAAQKPESVIGYLTFGPILYAFARFICDEIDELHREGKQPKVFFLLRDAHLLSLACEAYAGVPIGKRVRIRKFGTVAASFRTQEDVDHYLASLTPQYYDFWVICAQLLLPNELTQLIIQQAAASSHPQKTFNELLHRDEILQFIFHQSAAYRERLKRYIQKEMALEKGDTVVLVDVGYVGVTQDFLTRALQKELGVEIVGRYFIASHEPNRPKSTALITSTACDHGLFEQSCTYKEGCVLDYDQDGSPIFDTLKLSDNQYAKVKAVQDECIRFIQDAKAFFAATDTSIPLEMLRQTAIAALRRHVYLPTAHEINYYQGFQHDKDMGPTLQKTMYNLNQGLASLRQGQTLSQIHPYEARVAGLPLVLSALVQRSFELDLTNEDLHVRFEKIKIINVKGQATSETLINAIPTHDGYFACCAPAVDNARLGIVFGEHYQWVQIESINLINPTAQYDLSKSLTFHHMTQRNGHLFECLSTNSLLTIAPIADEHRTQLYHIVFRPIERRTLVKN